MTEVVNKPEKTVGLQLDTCIGMLMTNNRIVGCWTEGPVKRLEFLVRSGFPSENVLG